MLVLVKINLYVIYKDNMLTTNPVSNKPIRLTEFGVFAVKTLITSVVAAIIIALGIIIYHIYAPITHATGIIGTVASALLLEGFAIMISINFFKKSIRKPLKPLEIEICAATVEQDSYWFR